MVFSLVCRVAFGCALVTNLLWATALANIVHLLPLSKRDRGGYSLSLASLAFWLTIKLCPWIRNFESGDAADTWKTVFADAEKSGRPVFLVGNHLSFFDTPSVSGKLPWKAAFRMNTYMKQALMDIPILGSLSRCCEHFLVPYVNSDEFKVHAEKMQAVDDLVDAHVAAGGWLCFFPEGQLNKNPSVIQEIRHGGMKRAIKFDAIVISFVCTGNEQVWPLKAAVGGFPARVHWSLKTLAPDGTKALMESLQKDAASDKPDYEVLAEYVQRFFQTQYNDLEAEAGQRGKTEQNGKNGQNGGKQRVKNGKKAD
jgi:1-acyl-sn-glycerol-3-phosphate acyltransferase